MLRFLPAPLLMLISLFLVVFNSITIGSTVALLGLVKLFTPQQFYPQVTRLANRSMWLWSEVNRFSFHLVNKTQFEINDNTTLSKEQWYLLICNHQSWADIVLLCMLFGRRIPMPKFFLKQSLLYVPCIGQACWALDMPFMRRYSREYLLKYPHKRGSDLAATKKSCEKFRHTPTTVINFVEGTRFSQSKWRQSHSPYQHLLPPKALGIAYTLSVLGEQFSEIIDVSLAYPDLPQGISPFKAMLSGRLSRVVLNVRCLPIEEQLRGDYLQDPIFKQQFKLWLDGVWQEKDRHLSKALDK